MSEDKLSDIAALFSNSDDFNERVAAALLECHIATGINLAQFGEVGEFVKINLYLDAVPDNGV